MSSFKGQFGFIPDTGDIQSASVQSHGVWRRLYELSRHESFNPDASRFEAANMRRINAEAAEKRKFQKNMFVSESFSCIGGTQTTTLYSVTHKTVGNVTLKKFQGSALVDCIWKELDILAKIRHENIARLYGAFYDGRPFIVLESGTTLLSKCLVEADWNEPVISKLSRDITMGISYLHSQGIVHCGVDPDSIMVTARNNFVLTNLANAVFLKGTNQFTIESKIGRPNYLNLEALLEGKYSKKTDLWSLACLIFHLTTSEHLVQPPTGRNTFESCATVIREGYPLVGNGGHRTVETVYDRINRSKRGKLLRPLLQSSQEPENVIEIFLRETEAIVSGDNSANPSAVLMSNWFQKLKQGAPMRPITDPFQEAGKIPYSSIACLKFYHDFTVLIDEEPKPSSSRDRTQQIAQEFLDDFDHLYSKMMSGDSETMQMATTIIQEVMQSE